MDDSEKMVALKKAYADIILDAAKEAAARVMASERRALRSQHELNAVKGDSIHLLLRLKKMIDAKETEAEIDARSQRRRIEELEAHLQETSNKISGLRVELGAVSGELQKEKTEMKVCIGENDKKDAVYPKDEILKEHLKNIEPIVPYSSDSELEAVAAPVAESRASSRGTQDHHCPVATTRNGRLSAAPLENDRSRCSGHASVIGRSSEPEQYRNGCTQRIRAFERQQGDATLSVGDVSDGCNLAVDWMKSMENKRSTRDYSVTFHKANCLGTGKELQEEKKKSKLPMRRRRKSHFGRSKSTSRRSNLHVLRCCQHSSFVADYNLAHPNTKDDEAVLSEIPWVDVGHDMHEHPDGLKARLHNSIHPAAKGKALKGKRKREVAERKHLATSFRSVNDLSRTSRLDNNVKRGAYCHNPLLLLSKMAGDSVEVVRRSNLLKKDEKPVEVKLAEKSKDAKVSDMMVCGVDPKNSNVPVRNCYKTDVDVADDSKGPENANDSRDFKYSFHRKWKKDSLGDPFDEVHPKKGCISKSARDSEDAREDYNESNVVKGSSRDARRLKQVARQVGFFKGLSS